MLLRENFLLLSFFNLSQVHFSLLRNCFKNSENVAKFKLQLDFTLKCRENDIFPKTIANLHLPQFYRQPRFTPRSIKLKRSIVRDMVRFLRSEYYKTLNNIQRCNNLIREQFDEVEAVTLIDACKAVYLHTLRVKKSHFHSKLNALLESRRASPEPRTVPETEPSTNDLVTDLSGALNSDELSLLARGPGFAIKPQMDDRTKLDIQTQLCRLAYQVRWRHNRETRNELNADSQTTTLPKYPQSTFTCIPPSASDELELALRGSYNEISRYINSVNKDAIQSNLTKKERGIIKELRSKPYVYLPSDKGSEFCVIDQARYNEAGEDHLSNAEVYSKAKIAVSTIETRVNKVWKSVCGETGLATSVQRSYIIRNSRLPEFYHLVKTHKQGPELKIRPIIASRGSPTSKLSWLMAKILKPLLVTFPAHLESSHQLMEALSNIPPETLRSHQYPFSLDVNALFTSIPSCEAIEALTDYISNQNEVTATP